ncbi:hypothetical protein CKM354_001114600 [Cercospora kikuchii]|uniref:Uncharacterized protein n=1 Tax=Cercospora kikuchii TaxID=84275 RepID=A0A9P3CSL1_9PEZI|nr:uncharacterized protein CKM354_001114600 [Cercospora kikuchii]GIZ48071.1 hypothetical protein CKM354_001114600 [Cercospora kikuchii]
MPSRLTLLILLTATIALLLSPSLISISHTVSTEVKATPTYVRDKSLEYTFVRGALIRGSIPLDAMILKRNEHTFGPIHALRNEVLQIEIPGSGVLRSAKVLRNREKDFAYREELEYGMWLLHTIRFVEVGKRVTRLEYEKRWKGSAMAYGLGKMGLLKSVGSETTGSLEGLGKEIEEAYAEEKEKWGNSRYG